MSCNECGKVNCNHTRLYEPPPDELDLEFISDDDDWLVGVTCNPDDPEECEACQ